MQVKSVHPAFASLGGTNLTGESHRIFRQFLGFKAGSAKVALSPPAHPRVTQTVGWLTIIKQERFEIISSKRGDAMEIYTEIASWIGWPAVVALLIVAGGFAGWLLNNRISELKDINDSLQKGRPDDSTDYGIKIISPKNNDFVGQFINVTGSYSKIPPPDTLRLFTVKPERTEKGERFWPQEIVKEFNTETKSWSARVNIGDPNESEWGIIVAVIGQSTTVLWDFYYRIGPQVGWWDFQGWPTDSQICHRISVKRV